MKRIFEKWRTKRLVCAIRKADDMQAVEIVKALIERYQKMDPNVEPVFVILPRDDPDESRRILDLLYDTIK